MIILSKEEFEINKEQYFDLIDEGAVFIYPTDTIYGIGCSALNDSAVKKLRRIKKRPKMPFSIIVPSKEWIYENCEVSEDDEAWIKKLPGPYTLIFNLKKDNVISKLVNPSKKTIGVRIPKHWIAGFVEELGFPIITTSVNISGQEYMTSLDNLNEDIKQKVDFIIYDGEILGRPSTIVDLTGKEPKVINR